MEESIYGELSKAWGTRTGMGKRNLGFFANFASRVVHVIYRPCLPHLLLADSSSFLSLILFVNSPCHFEIRWRRLASHLSVFDSH